MGSCAAAALTLLAGAATAGVRPYPTSCEPEGVPLVAKSGTATLFIQRTQGRAGRSLYGCFRADTRIFELGTRDPDEAYFSPPAVSLAGSIAAWASDTYNADGDRITLIKVHDLERSIAVRSTKAGTRYPKVGSLVVNSTGGVAWITCPSDDASARGSQRPNCLKAGALEHVYALRTGAEKPRLLEKSRRIEPRSLRREGDRISWISNGKRRRALLE